MKKERISSEKFFNHIELLLGEFESKQLIDAINSDLKTSVRYNSRIKSTKDLKGEVVPWCTPFGRFWDEENPPSTTLEYATGQYYIQESSAMLAVSAAAKVIDFSDKVVVDLTAAPGGKATQVAELISNGYLVANEVKKHRVQALLWNVNRHRLHNVIVTSSPTEMLVRTLSGFFDVVLVDAPCSGEGLFQRKKHSLQKWSKKNVQHCARRQRTILNDATVLLGKGGFLVYSTCTFSKEENEDQVEYLLRQGFSPVPLPTELPVSPAISINTDVAKCSRRIFPHREGGAGAFVAVVQKDHQNHSPFSGQYIYAKKKAHSLKTNILGNIKLDALDGFIFQKKGLFFYFSHDTVPEVLWRYHHQIGALIADQLRGDKMMYGSIQIPAPDKIIRVNLLNAQRYIKGESFPLTNPDGFYYLAHEEIILGPVLMDSGIAINQFPKPLQRPL